MPMVKSNEVHKTPTIDYLKICSFAQSISQLSHYLTQLTVLQEVDQSLPCGGVILGGIL